MTTVQLRTPPTWSPARVLAMIAVVVSVTVAGLTVTATRVEAADCLSASCHGKSPSAQGCTPGTVLREIYPATGVGLSLRKKTECGTARWARLVWDGDGPNPPKRFNSKVERQQYYDSYGWLFTHSQSHTSRGGLGAFVTPMVATGSNADARHRACVRWSHVVGGEPGDYVWSSWSSWHCTSWQTGPA